MKNKKTPHSIAVTALVLFIVLGLACANVPSVQSPQPTQSAQSVQPTATEATEDFSYPLNGITNDGNLAAKDFTPADVNLAAKDFTPIEIIFVNSVEVIDSQGNHSGSKITHEMFMREAVRLRADNVINIKIDVKQSIEKVGTRTVTTYTYTGIGLAIKYAGAVGR